MEEIPVLSLLLPCDLMSVSSMGQSLPETGVWVMHSIGQKTGAWRMNEAGRQTSKNNQFRN